MNIESNFGAVLMGEASLAFGPLVAPINAMASATSNDTLTIGDTVKVPYTLDNSGSYEFNYNDGYGSTNNTKVGCRAVTLDNLLFQRFTINDNDSAKLSSTDIANFVRQAAVQLAGDVVSASFSSVITDSNYPISASCTSGQLTSSIAIADLVLQADNSEWTIENRNMILGASAWNSLIKNTQLSNAFSYGGSEVVKNGLPTNVYGFNTYKTTVDMPANVKGLVLNPSAILFASGQHKPADSGKKTVGFQSTISNGITLTLRNWYEENNARTVFALECLFGVEVGNKNALFQMK